MKKFGDNKTTDDDNNKFVSPHITISNSCTGNFICENNKEINSNNNVIKDKEEDNDLITMEKKDVDVHIPFFEEMEFFIYYYYIFIFIFFFLF
jgi:hypothetical protein